VFLQRERDVFRQGEGGPERSGLVHHAKAAGELGAAGGRGGGEVLPVIENLAFGGFAQADEVAEQGALAAPGAADDDKDIAVGDLEVEVAHDNE
jgi:hypothetical protein